MRVETTFLSFSLLVISDENPQFIKDFICRNAIQLPTPDPEITAVSIVTPLEYLRIMPKSITEAGLKVKQGNKIYRFGQYNMALFNYVVYHFLAINLVHGREVTSLFFEH
ncbi:hypothetical protein [Pediococcus acidilactici]|uniref:hypothetical protein n=1 Tax=Pediococcus acidilactici TaxID=1254 RepID=UPI0030092259